MAKRKTREQRNEIALLKLFQRILDIYSGACGELRESEEWFVGGKELSRIVPAIASAFGIPKDDYRVSAFSLHHYSDPDTLTDFLFEYNIRSSTTKVIDGVAKN